MRTLRLALAQVNQTVGDLDGNTAKILDYIKKARNRKADVVAFPELALTGYPPEDLLFKSQFVEETSVKMREIVEASVGITVVVGLVEQNEGIRNGAAVVFDGNVLDVYHKIHLPNYGVFDEKRYFIPGTRCPVFVINGTRVGLNICEDIWEDGAPTDDQVSDGAEVLLNISGSPFYAGRLTEREAVLRRRAVDHQVFLAYLNMVGGQDELVFDGGSMVIAPDGSWIAQGGRFREELIVADLKIDTVPGPKRRIIRTEKEVVSKNKVGESGLVPVSGYAFVARYPVSNEEPEKYEGVAEVYEALRLGTRDYVHKNGFTHVVVCLSGGIDSSLVAAIAVDALGRENITGVAMPSRYSSESSVSDARQLSANLGIDLKVLPIEQAFKAHLDILSPDFEGLEAGVAEENLQSRIRGVLVMALSNKFGWMVMTTGNKSEMAVGYTTIYGDMAGGYGVIMDVPKTMVYELARYRNSISGDFLIPKGVIEKAPSAELRPCQIDQDNLPPYDVLDPILKAYVEDDMSFEQIVNNGFDSEVVKDVISLVDRSEYKRRQAPPGIKITPRNFGRDRRMPIANQYKPF